MKASPQINSGAMADIAFLLLIFFLVTTTIVNDKGIFLLLPPDQNDMTRFEIHDRNLFKIQINSNDKLLIENEIFNGDFKQLRQDIQSFILNRGKDPNLSDSPEKAIVSLKTDRGTTQKKFIQVLDEIKGAYHEIYARRARVSHSEWLEIASFPDKSHEFLTKYQQGRDIDELGKVHIPMNISIAEPTGLPNNARR